jgi:hypothetical protein
MATQEVPLVKCFPGNLRGDFLNQLELRVHTQPDEPLQSGRRQRELGQSGCEGFQSNLAAQLAAQSKRVQLVDTLPECLLG